MLRRSAWISWVALAVSWSASSTGAAADSVLPRKTATESYAGVVVRYDVMSAAAGHRLRLILTYPSEPAVRFPTVFLAGWLSCDSVEAPPGTKDATQLVLQDMAKLPGFATVRLEKAGVGDSKGDCAQTDFTAELGAYRQAFLKTRNYPFVDPGRIFILGVSDGGGFAPPRCTGRAGQGVCGRWRLEQDLVRAHARNRTAPLDAVGQEPGGGQLAHEVRRSALQRLSVGAARAR